MPALQTVAPGDIMPAVPGADGAFMVAVVEPSRDLVLVVPDGHGGNAVTWSCGTREAVPRLLDRQHVVLLTFGVRAA